jgi:DedD protein
MGLFSFFQRKDDGDGRRPPGKNRASARAQEAPPSADAVQQARTRARRRLIGATVLLGIGVIGFPLLFETQPRPIPVNIPIELPPKDGAPPLAMPAPRAAARGVATPPPEPAPRTQPEMIVEGAGEQGREVPPPAASAPVRMAAASAAPRVASGPKPAASAPRPAASASKPAAAPDDEARRVRAMLDGKPAASAAAPKASDPAAAGRFVVQVGSFSEAESAREARLKVERLGLKTYTQVAEIDGAKRIRVRVGPYASRDEANQAVSKLKGAGLAAAVLTL